jgi:hypothetical protein
MSTSVFNLILKNTPMKNLLLLLTTPILLLALLSGCKKEDPTPTYHKDVFHCKVNGVAWSATCPSTGLFGCEPIDCQYYWKDTKFFSLRSIKRLDDDSIYQGIRMLGLQTILGEMKLAYTKEAFTDLNNPSGCRFYELDTIPLHKLTILEIDTVKYIIKGTFEFVSNNECQDTIRITDGFFHVNFRF